MSVDGPQTGRPGAGPVPGTHAPVADTSTARTAGARTAGARTPEARAPTARAKRIPGEERRAQIIEAAREMFIRHGYDGARTKEIAERAGTREGVLYRHFESKEQLFDAAVLEPLTDWVDSASMASTEIADAAGPEERAAALRRTNERLVEAIVAVTPMLGAALFSSSERGQAFYREHFYPLLEESFRQSERAMGGQWSAPEFDARFLMLSGIGIYLAHALDVHFRGVEVDSGQTAARYVQLLSRGAMREPDSGPDNRSDG